MSDTCLCLKCAPKEKFNSAECMWCGKGISGTGKLNAPNGARVCTDCVNKAFKALEKAIKEENQI